MLRRFALIAALLFATVALCFAEADVESRDAESPDADAQLLLGGHQFGLRQSLVYDSTLSDRDLLHAALQLLNSASAKTEKDALFRYLRVEEPLDLCIRRLASHEWKPRERESLRDYLRRLANDSRPNDPQLDTEKINAGYKTLTGRDSPLDWRMREDHWLSLVEAIVESKGAADPAQIWKQKIEKDPDHALLYRFAYLEVVRAAEPKQIDRKLLRPLVESEDPDLSDLEKLRRTLLLLSAFDKLAVVEDDPFRVELELRLMHDIETVHLTDDSTIWWSAEWRLFAEHFAPGKREKLLKAGFQHQPALSMESLRHSFDVPDEESRQRFLFKPVGLNVEETPLNNVLRQLEEQVYLPLWIGDSARRDETPVTLKSEGAWFDVLEQVLAQSENTVFLLPPNIIWIGPPHEREEAARFLHEAARHAAAVPALAEETECEFFETPWYDAAEFMKDLHNMSLTGSPKETDRAVTFNIRGVPAFLAMALIAREAGLEWGTFDGSVIIGDRDWFGRCQKAEQSYKRSMLQLGRFKLEGHAIVDALEEETECEFIETPLIDTAEFLGVLHNINIAVASPDQFQTPINYTGSRQSLALALSLLLVEPQLGWTTDGNLLLIGDDQARSRFHAQCENRDERRKKYPKSISEKLRKTSDVTVDLSHSEVSLATLSEETGLKIGLSAEAAKLPKPEGELSLSQVPLDVTLDVLVLQLGLTWEATAAGEIVLRPAKDGN